MSKAKVINLDYAERREVNMGHNGIYKPWVAQREEKQKK